MDWKKLGIFGNLNRFDVWQIVFGFLDIKSVINGVSKSCKSFKSLCLQNISHIKSICILSLTLDTQSSLTNLNELLKCEKTFLLKLTSNYRQGPPPALYTNKSVVRLKYKTKNGSFSLLAPLIKSLSNFNYFTLSGNSQMPVLTEKVIAEFLPELKTRKMNYFKISKVTLTASAFKFIKKYLKDKTPMIVILDFNCFYEKAVSFQESLAEIWKKKWLLNIDYKLNGKILFSCTREFLTN